MRPDVPVFFYGSYMNRDVLAEVAIVPAAIEVARLAGFDLRIAPRANLVPSDAHMVYGTLCTATHAELERLYAHALDVLGERYLPYPVLVESNGYRPALTYICRQTEPRPPEPAYVERILAPARALGFPPWYLERIASELP